MVTVIIGPGTMAPDNPTANDVAVNIRYFNQIIHHHK